MNRAPKEDSIGTGLRRRLLAALGRVPVNARLGSASRGIADLKWVRSLC